MCERDKQIGGYRLRQTDHSVEIDERLGFVFAPIRILFGLAFIFPLILLVGASSLKDGFLGVKWDSDSLHRPIWIWLIFLPFICIPFVFAFFGAFVGFTRNYIKATSDEIFNGYKWFGFLPRLKRRPVSEISIIQINWWRVGPIGGRRRVCGIFIILAKTGRLVALFSCSKKGPALRLAKIISEKTRLPVEDKTNS